MDTMKTMVADPASYPFKGKLKDHQVRALGEARLAPGHCYWLDPGAGKTAITIAEASHLYVEGKIDGMIVVAPMGPHEQYIEEQMPLWCAIEWNGIHNKMTPGQIRKYLADTRRRGLAVMSINYDALRTTAGQDLLNAFIAKHPRIYLVIDESQKIKNPRAQRTKETLVLALRAAYRRPLSGTPILKGLEDLWSQYEAAEPGLAWPHQPIALNKGGKGVNTYGYIGYRNHFCKLAPVPGNPRAQRIVGYRNEAELQDRVRPFSTRILAAEFMKGEKPDIIPVRTPLSPAQRVQYNMMKDHLIAMMEDGTLTAQNALVQLGKLQQISAGFLYRENDEDHGWEMLGSTKIEATFDLLEQLDEPVIVWTHFRAIHQMLVTEMNNRNARQLWEHRPVFTGTDQVELWKKTPNGILVGNQTSGLGVGMNLQHAAANIYVTNSFSSEARWQSIKRTDRIGQTRQVRVWDLVAPGTVDEKIMAALATKEEISRRTIDGLRELL